MRRAALLVLLLLALCASASASADRTVTSTRVAVPRGELDGLRARLNATRRVPRPAFLSAEDAAARGGDPEELEGLAGAWSELVARWDETEERLNRLNHFRASVDGGAVDLHFVRSPPREGSVPLLYVHGWPGSFLECEPIMPLLEARGYDVVCPSLPGFGLSPAPPRDAYSARDAARALVELMALLGARRYAVAGGDWGGIIAVKVALADPGACAALHTNFFVAAPELGGRGILRAARALAERVAPSWLLPADQAARVAAAGTLAQLEQYGYLHLQMTRPLSLAPALVDSPAGLLAWLHDKYSSWSGPGGVPRRFELESATLYWLGGSAESSVRLYHAFLHSGDLWGTLAGGWYVSQPTAVAVFPRELLFVSRPSAEAYANVRSYEFMPRGGHFAAVEEPALLAESMASFFDEHVKGREAARDEL